MRALSRKKRLIVALADAIGAVLVRLANQFGAAVNEGQQVVTKILVLELWGLGDIVLATPALAALRARYPKARIVLLAKPYANDLLKGSHWVDEIIAYDFPWTAFAGKYRVWRYKCRELVALIRRLRGERFDLAICARGDARNNVLMYLSGSRSRVGYGYAGGGCFLTRMVSPDPAHPHRVDAWRGLLVSLGVNVQEFRPTLPVTEDEAQGARATLEHLGVRPGEILVGMHPGARQPVRRWGLEKFAELGDKLMERSGIKVVIFCDEDGYGSSIPMQHQPIVVRGTLRDLMALLKHCDLLICNDSGPMHLSVGVGTRVVAIFGPGLPRFIGPYGAGHRVVIQDGFPCRPCFDRCIFDRPYCLTTMDCDQVLPIIEEEVLRLKASSMVPSEG